MVDTDWLKERADEFAGELKDLLSRTINARGVIESTVTQERALVQLADPSGSKKGPVVTVAGRDAASIVIRLGLRVDRSGQYIAVTKSALALYSLLDGAPLFRLEYQDDMRTAPSAHWQVHAERGALSHLLTVSGHDRPHQLSALHIPVGGARMRPGVEDFLQFAIEECGVDSIEGYAEAISNGRERWRRRQIASAVRDVPTEAARVLRALGYAIEEPPDGEPPTRLETLINW